MRVRYDATAIAGLDDPYPAYAALREAGPVVPAGPGVWAVTGHADVTALLADPRVGHEFPDVVYQASGEPDAVTGFFRATVLNRDAPVHTVLRRAMSRLLAPGPWPGCVAASTNWSASCSPRWTGTPTWSPGWPRRCR
ncbi:hypothetical protein V2I01_42000 [Micromonospora sp. BRA006-A]|nr:hypothetical protein [Micromonospora sp. BRA006-A]